MTLEEQNNELMGMMWAVLLGIVLLAILALLVRAGIENNYHAAIDRAIAHGNIRKTLGNSYLDCEDNDTRGDSCVWYQNKSRRMGE